MGLKLTGRQRNIIFIIVIIFSFFSVAFTYKLGAKQNQGWRENYIEFQQGLQLIGEEKYSQAEEVLEALIQKGNNQDSYYVYWNYALCFYKQEKYPQAKIHYQKVRELNPLIVNNDKFLMQYGKILYFTQEYEQALKYLERAMKVSGDGEIKNEVVKLVNEIKGNKAG